MNARALYKRMHRRQHSVLWGRRALFTLRVPKWVYPERPPAFMVVAQEGSFEGQYLYKEGETWVELDVSHWSSGREPDLAEEALKLATIVGIGITDTGFSWWEGRERVYATDPHLATDTLPEPIAHRKPDVALIKSHIIRHEWIWTWIHGCNRYSYEPTMAPPFVAALHRANCAAKTQYFSETEEHVLITWSVKAFYRGRLRRFCADIHRVYRLARKMGIPIKGWVE